MSLLELQYGGSSNEQVSVLLYLNYLSIHCQYFPFHYYTKLIVLIKRYSLTRVKLTALYKHLITKTTLTYISANKTLIIIALITIIASRTTHTSLRSSTHTTINKILMISNNDTNLNLSFHPTNPCLLLLLRSLMLSPSPLPSPLSLSICTHLHSTATHRHLHLPRMQTIAVFTYQPFHHLPCLSTIAVTISPSHLPVQKQSLVLFQCLNYLSTDDCC